MDGPMDPWPSVLSLPGRFVGDPASLARDNIYISLQMAFHISAESMKACTAVLCFIVRQVCLGNIFCISTLKIKDHCFIISRESFVLQMFTTYYHYLHQNVLENLLDGEVS